jgi:hypothetical protein
MHGQCLFRANRELATKLLAVSDDGRFGGFARHQWQLFSTLLSTFNREKNQIAWQRPLP